MNNSRIELVIAATQDEWAQRVTRWVADHSDEVLLRDHYVFRREDALHEGYDVLIADADASVLDATLVERLHQAGRSVVGIADPELPHARSHLEGLEVDRVLDEPVEPAGVVQAAVDAAELRREVQQVVDGFADADPWKTGGSAVEGQAPSSCLTVVTGPIEGEGASEVAIETAVALRRRGETVTLVDADLIAPSLAQRLRLRFDLNVHTAVDAVVHRSGTLADALQPSPTGGFDALVGVEHPGKWPELEPGELMEVVHALRGVCDHVVVVIGSALEDLPGGRHAVARTLVSAADRFVVVAGSHPIAAERLTRWLVEAAPLVDDLARVHVACNRSPGRSAAAQLDAELTRTARLGGISHLPADAKVPRASWAGEVTARGRFTRAVADLAEAAVPRIAATTGKRRRRSRQ